MSQKDSGKAGSRDNAELSRVATQYLSGDMTREEVCDRLNGEQRGGKSEETGTSPRRAASSDGSA